VNDGGQVPEQRRAASQRHPGTPPRGHTIRLHRVLPAPPAVVFKALTDPRQVATWSRHDARIGRRLGGPFEMFDGWATGRVVVFRPPRRFACTWRASSWRATWDNSLVEWQLTADARGTKVELVHSLLPTAREAADHRKGWIAYGFEPLGEYLRKRGMVGGVGRRNQRRR